MSKYELGAFVEPLCSWYEKNKREMPWRDQGGAYEVWISEIMLQQTRIEAVKAYYDRFLKRLPDLKSLAHVPEEELLKLWQGLGYYNRARNLQKAALKVEEEFGGQLPADYEALKSLPGIGNYTAGAIASIAYRIPAPAVDGNVMRVTMRLLACYDDIMKEKNRREMEKSLMEVMPKDKPGEFNQAWMELGEVICIPNGAPLCHKCPLKDLCQARAKEVQLELPLKPAKKERRQEKRTLLIFRQGDLVAIQKRPDQGLLASMWEFPALEGHRTKKSLVEAYGPEAINKGSDYKHIFSHVEWQMKSYILDFSPQDVERLQEDFPRLKWAKTTELRDVYPIPTAFQVFLKDL
ncbi:MAG: A/G-specific adenine glycosylase [Eubacterium sp.]|nr:A/G-specific adenine glycosylase [Eubacterium sp.]